MAGDADAVGAFRALGFEDVESVVVYAYYALACYRHRKTILYLASFAPHVSLCRGGFSVSSRRCAMELCRGLANPQLDRTRAKLYIQGYKAQWCESAKESLGTEVLHDRSTVGNGS